MGKPTGFLDQGRRMAARRSAKLRIADWNEVYLPRDEETSRLQGARCMDCGVPFCQSGCPLQNRIPDWNDSVYRGNWQRAYDQLTATNNFPEFTGRVCPAPCEASCTLSINDSPVTIEQIELEIIERAYMAGWVEAGEDPAVTVVREAREEVGLDVVVDRLVGVHHRPASASLRPEYWLWQIGQRQDRQR